MKYQIFQIILLFTTVLLHSQDGDKNQWVMMENELTNTLTFSKSEILNVDGFSIEVIWDNKLSYSDNLGH